MKQKKILKRVMSFILAIVLVAGTIQVMGPNTPIVVEAAGESLITNGGFDTVTGWTYTGADDSTGNVPAQKSETVKEPIVVLEADCEDSSNDSRWVDYNSNGTVQVVNDPNDTSNRVASYTNTHNTNTGLAYKPDAYFFETGKTYTISFDYKGAAQFHVYTLGLVGAGYDLYDDWLPKSENEWTTYSFEITPTYNSTNGASRIMFQMATSGGGTFYIDNLKITCGEAEKTTEIVTEVVENGDFATTDISAWGEHEYGSTANSGSYSLVTEDTNNYISYISTEVDDGMYYQKAAGSIIAGTTYTISFKYKGDAKFHVFTTGFKGTDSLLKDWIACSDNWQTASYEVTATEGNTSSVTKVFFKLCLAGTMYIDDLSITSSETVTATTYTQGIGTCIENDVATEEDNVLYVDDYKSVSTPVEIKAGKRYEYSFKMKHGATGSDFDFGVQIGGEKVADVKSGKLAVSEEWETISGVIKATADATTFGFLRSGEGNVYIDDVTLVEMPSDHTPSLEEGYIPEGATTLRYVDFTTTNAGAAFPKFELEDGMAYMPMDGQTNYMWIQGLKAEKGHTYVFAFYIWIRNAGENFNLNISQGSTGAGGPTGETSELHQLMDPARRKDYCDITIDGADATDAITKNTSGWKKVEVTWTAKTSDMFDFYVRAHYSETGEGQTADVYIDDVAVYDNSEAAAQEQLLTNYYDLGSGTEGYLVTSGADETVTITDAARTNTTVENGAYTTINEAGEYTITRGGVKSEIVLYNRGDANADYDSEITAKDLVATKKKVEDIVIYSASAKAADANADGILTSEDAAFLRRAIVNDYDIINTTKGVSSLGQGVMPIIGYDGPTNVEDFKKFSTLGMNYVVVNATDISSNDALAQEILEAAQLNDIKVFLNNDKAVNPDESSKVTKVDDLASYNNDYDSYDSFTGYYVADGAYYKKQYTSDSGKYFANNGIAEYADVLGTVAKYVNVNSYFNLLPMNSEELGYSISGSEDSVTVTYDNYAAYAHAASIAGSEFLLNEVPLSNGASNFYKNLAWMRAVSLDETIAKPFYGAVRVDESNTANMYLEANVALAFGAKGIRYDAVTEASGGAYSINQFIKAVDYILMDAQNKGVITTDSTIQGYIDRGTIENYGAVASVSGDNALVGCFDYFGNDTYLVVNTDTTASTSVTLTFSETVEGAVTAFNCSETTFEANSYTVALGAGESVLVVLDYVSGDNGASAEGKDDTATASTSLADTIVKANELANGVQAYYTDGNKTSYTVENQNVAFAHNLSAGSTKMTAIKNEAGVAYPICVGNSFDVVMGYNGGTYYSQSSSTEAWANTTKLGYYYYETNLWNIDFGSSVPNLYLEKAYHTYSDKMYQAFRVISNGADTSEITQLGFRAIIPVAEVAQINFYNGTDEITSLEAGNVAMNLQYAGFDISGVGVIGFIVAGQSNTYLQVTKDANYYYVSQFVKSFDFTSGEVSFGNRVYTDSTHTFDGLKEANYEEQNPLTSANITVDTTVSGAEFVGYDYLTGAYKFNIDGSGYTNAFNNKDNVNYFEHIQITGVEDDRVIYLDVHSDSATEGAALVDSTGTQIPVPMQVSKNFAEENVTPIYNPDTEVYGETYMPLSIKAGEEYDFTVINAYWNWGDEFPIKQLSSIEYFTSYYHMSTGTVETTCIAPYYAANGNDGFFDGISYFLPDFRGMSNGTLDGDVIQNNSVGVVYGPSNGSSLGTYTGTNIHSTGLTYSDMDYSYISDDGAFKYTMRHVEMPQEDESRTYYTIEFEILKDTTLTQEDFEIIGFDGKNGIYQTAQYIDKNGNTQTLDLWKEGFSIAGIQITKGGFQNTGYYPLSDNGSYFAFYDMELLSTDYPQTGNFGLIVKNSDVSLAFANQTHTPEYWHKTELNYGYLTLAADTAFKAGDTFSVDLILLPFGEVGDTNCDSVVEVYNDSVANALGVTATTGTVVEDAWVPTVKADDNIAEFTLTGGVNENTSGDTVNYAVKVTGFDSLMTPAVQQYVDGEWVSYEYATGLGYDGYSVAYEDDGTYTYSFVFAQTAAGNTFRVTESKSVTVNYYVGDRVAKTIQAKTGEVVTKASESTLGIFGQEIVGYYTDPAFVRKFDFASPLTDDTDIYIKLSNYIYINADMVSTMTQGNITSSGATTDSTYGDAYQVVGAGNVNMALYKTGLNLKVGDAQKIKFIMKSTNVTNVQVKLLGTYVDMSGVTQTTDVPSAWTGTQWNETRYVAYTSGSNGAYKEYTIDLTSGTNAVGSQVVSKYVTITGIQFMSSPIDNTSTTLQYLDIASVEQVVDATHTVTYILDGETLKSETVNHDCKISAPTDVESQLGYQLLGYFMDEACTVPYDFGNWIIKDTTIYVDKGDTLYLSANALTTFKHNTSSPSSSTGSIVDGAYRFVGVAGSNDNYIYNAFASAIDITKTQKIEIKAKAVSNIKQLQIFPVDGQKTTGYSGAYCVTFTAGETDEDGYTTYTADLSSFGMTQLTHVRIDIDATLSQEERIIDILYIKAVE